MILPGERVKGECPNCGSDDLEYFESDCNGETVSYEYMCRKCKVPGVEWYELKHIETVMDGEEDGPEEKTKEFRDAK